MFAILQLCASPVLLTDEISTVRFIAAWLFLLKEYRAPIVGTPGDVTLRQESQPVWLSRNLAVGLYSLCTYDN